MLDRSKTKSNNGRFVWDFVRAISLIVLRITGFVFPFPFFVFYYCPVNTENSLSDKPLCLYKSLINIQPKEYRVSMFKRTRISRITRISMRDEYFLIRGEYHEFYHPDGIREIRMRLANLNLHSNSCYSWNSCSLKHRNTVFSRVQLYKGLVWVQRSIKQWVIYIYRTTIFFYPMLQGKRLHP